MAVLAGCLGVLQGRSAAQGADSPAAARQAAGTPTLTGESRPLDVILARRNLMAAIGRNRDELEAMLESPEPLGLEAAEHAGTISVLLLAFPHLFPPQTNNWSPQLEEEDPARVSRANPRVWTDFDSFYGLAQTASQLALDASLAPTVDAFRQSAKALIDTCDTCHATFRREEKEYAIPVPPPQ
ncbi:cytochrome c [Arenibaculum pallidiluteum]|uniref:cytochrome c n=1 Tax=Arenibaculum pallidiluteum TaxID=2812559 RepID=UPI001A971B1C|nr:cytochrome c [Arenibaculum pallidiluteum]